jgi:hypothetical protein
VRDASGSLELMVNEYRLAAPKLGLVAPTTEDLYTRVCDGLGSDSYLSYTDLHTPGAVPHAEAISRHQAKEGAKKGNQGDISGISKYPVRYVECVQRQVRWGTLSWSKLGDTVVPSLSVPGHNCGDEACTVCSKKGSFTRVNKKELLELLDDAWDGGEAVYVNNSGVREFICPLVKIAELDNGEKALARRAQQV